MPDRGIEWRNEGRAGKGHVWENGYRDGALVTVRCANCRKRPTSVMRLDFSIKPCRGRSTPDGSPPIPDRCRELLQDDLTEKGMQMWWERYLERHDGVHEQIAVADACRVLATLGHRSGYYA